MKRIFTHLFVTVLLLLSSTAWAQSGTTTLRVIPSDGYYNRESWAAKWETTGNPKVVISVSNNVNNMNSNATDDSFQFYVGLSSPSTWNFSVSGCVIESYSFKFSSVGNNNVTITAGNKTMTSTSSEQTWSVENVNAQTASFQLSGGNNGIVVTELTFIVHENFEVGQVYMFKNARPDTDRSLSANGTDDVHTKATDVNDLKQQWYVTKDSGYYVLRNLAYGKYLKGNGKSSAWGMSDDYSSDSTKFELYVSNTTLNTLHTKGLDDHAYMHDDNRGEDGGYNVVGWANADSNTGTHWTITKVDYTAEEIKALLDAVPTPAEIEAYDDALAALFKDGACTELKDEYTSMSVEDIKADANYKALPATLQKTVLKIKNDSWGEDNADATKKANNLNWDGKYAKKFRVQMYEPYSIAGDITSFLKINAHSNNDNPTGIYVNAPGYIYVMVEGEIKPGATLRLIDAGSNRRIEDKKAISDGVELKQGLNVVPFTEAGGHLYICYNVDTYNPDGNTSAERFPHKLSDYAPLKIHIEGGAINGFYNACGDFLAGKTYDGVTYNSDLWKEFTGASVDCDDDWEYMETRANLSVLPVLGHRQIMLFQLDDVNGSKGLRSLFPESITVPDKPYNRTGNWNDYGMGLNPATAKINIYIEAWDRIMYSEHATLGLVSKADMDIMNDFYPRWKNDGTHAEIYDYNNAGPDGKTYQEFCDGVDYSEYFNHHGVALGATSGYMSAGWNAANYNISTFEELMSLAASHGPIWGPAHEIGHQHQDIFNVRGGTEVTNNVFSNAAVWYMGMATSRYSSGHLNKTLNEFNAGKSFIDYDIWSMTQMLYKLWLYYHLAGNNTQFYPRFFELLRHSPLNAMASNVNGTESLLKLYETVCDAAGEDLTEFFRVHGFFVLLDGYAKEDYGITVFTQTQEEVDASIARVKAKYSKQNYSILLVNDGSEPTVGHDGTTMRQIFDGATSSEMGSVNDFIEGETNVTASYTAVLNSDGTVTMSAGEGGVGFLIFDENGKLVSFSDRKTFELSDEALEAIVSGKANIVTIDAENNVTDVDVDITTLQKTALEQLIIKVQSIVDKIDNTYTKIGYFKGTAVADLVSALAYAKEVYDGSSGYEAAYDLLYAEYTKVLANTDSKIPFNPSLTYIITNYGNPAQTMWVNSENTVRSEGGVNQSSDDARWKFVETSTPGVYNIRTLNNDYIPAVQQSTSMTATTGQANNDALYTLEEVKDGVWAIKLSPEAGYRNLHSSWNNVVGWETGADASRWYLTVVEADPVIADLIDLEVYINKTELLLEEVLGTVTYTKSEALPLQTGTPGSEYYLWSNAPETREGDIANLVDGAANNYFHTDWSSQPVSGTHYLGVYLGENNSLSRFTFSHTTRSGAGSDFPKGVDVYGSNDGTTYKLIGSASKMPQTAGTTWEFDGVMLSSYKYLRFNYHANRGYWHMAEFDITPVTGFTATVNDTYSSTVDVTKVTAAMDAMLNGKRTAASFSPTTGDIAAKLSALQTAYNELFVQYEATINARKKTLAQLAAATETLVSQVGVVELAQEKKLDLTTENLYCNEVRADDCASNGATADTSANGYVNNLTDENNDTFLHTNYNNGVAVNPPHYLRVDLGENSTATGFKFTYTTRNNGNNCPTEIVVAGCAEQDGEYTTICTLKDTDANPLPNGASLVYKSSVISRNLDYRYIRFTVTKTEGSLNTFFVMSEFGMSIITQEKVTVNNTYKEYVTNDLLLTTVLVTNSSKAMSANELVTSVPMLDAQIADQAAAKATLEEAMAKLPSLDKTALQELYDDALALYEKMADGENVNTDYAPSALTNDMLTAAKGALDTAKEQLDAANTTQDVVDAVKDALQELYNNLSEIENKNVNISGSFDKSALNSAIELAEVLKATIEANSDYYTTATALGFDALNNALSAAQDAKDRFYLTQEQYTEALEQLNTCYNATLVVVNADCTDRSALQTAIANANTLLEDIAAKGEGYYSTVDNLGVDELTTALQNVQDVVDKYHTTEQCASLSLELNTCYNATLDVVNADYTGRDELSALMTVVDALVDGVVTVDETEKVIALQCDDVNAPYYIYCNAPGATNNYDGDNLGVAALLDVDEGGEPITATFLHTSYVAGSHDDDLDHYLRVDMGESNLLSFKFRYTPRVGNTSNAPLVMLIEGSNDCENFEEITTLTNMATTYESGEITNGKAYRYIRFMVKETQNNSTHDGHPFFAMSHFEMTACKTVTISQEYASPNLSVDVAANAYNKLVDAGAVVSHYATNADGATVKEELQAAYDALYAAIALQNIPVKLTTDVNNPVLYKIIINRDDNGNKRLQYDEATAMVAVADDEMDRYQAWYFMSGDDPTKDILILPYMGEGKVLATNSFSEGNSKVKAVEKGTDGYSYNWNIATIENSEWLNITILNGSGATFYFSNHGGVSHKMGFYNHSDDVGSQFKFVLDDTDYSLPDSYYLLYSLHNDCGGEKTEGDKIGQYAETTDYNAAYSAATTLLENKSATENEYATAYETLSAAFEALELNLPVEGGLYIIKSANSNAYSAGKQIYVDANNNPYFADATDASTYIWQFEPVDGDFMMKSLHTQSYVSGAAWATQVTLSDVYANAKTVTIGVLDDATGQVSITVSGGHPLHAQDAGSKLVGYTGGANSASAWYIEEISAADAKENVKHTVSLGANESGSDTNAYSTLYLAYNAKIPEGITASIVEEINEIGQLVLTPVTGGILPAKTAVVLSRETDGDVDFLYTDDEPTFDPTGNMLRGASCNELIECGDEHNVYMLAKKSGRVAFYWTYENRGADGNYVYINADEEIVASTATGAHRNHNKGGYVRCNANKAYLLESENSGQAAAAMYSLPIGGNATGVDDVKGENAEVKTIYDLQGRKLVKITEPGFYIVNGNKIYVTEVED